jgi:hypothetical protein
VVWHKVESRKQKLLVEFGLSGWLGPLPAPSRLDPAGLHRSLITDYCSLISQIETQLGVLGPGRFDEARQWFLKPGA